MTPTQRKNLAKLADYLAALPANYEHFDMNYYFADPTDDRGPRGNPTPSCGSVACAIGHGPAAGIKASRGDSYWPQYASRVFGLWAHDSKGGSWCFSDEWAGTDNTPAGAAARIRILLADGMPADWEDQMLGDAPLSYAVPA